MVPVTAIWGTWSERRFISQSMLSWGTGEDVYTQIKETVLGNTFHYAWRGPCLNSKSSIKVITMYCFCFYKSTVVTALEPCHLLPLCWCIAMQGHVLWWCANMYCRTYSWVHIAYGSYINSTLAILAIRILEYLFILSPNSLPCWQRLFSVTLPTRVWLD